MKKLRLFVFLAAFLAAINTAFAVQATFRCSFEPPADVLNEPGVEYVVEARRTDGTWVEVARGPGVVNTVQGEGSRAITYTDNAPFGVYTVRVAVIKPIRGPDSDLASTTLTPGKPTNPKVQSNR